MSVKTPARPTAKAPKSVSLNKIRAKRPMIIDIVPIFFVLRTAAVKTKVKSGVVKMTLDPGIGKNLLIK